MKEKKTYKKLNPLLHSQLRLAVVSYLVSNGAAGFKELKSVTGATSGNLSIQLQKLKEAGYINIHKGFKNNYPHTRVEITRKGIDAFEEYVNAIKQYLK